MSPVIGPTAAAVAATRARTARGVGHARVAVDSGQQIWLRWQDLDDAGIDHGLAIDDFSVIARGAGDDAPSVVSTLPANQTTNVAVDANIVITFSESVDATASAFAIECPTGSPQAFAQSGSPSNSFTLNPTVDLPSGAVCTVTVTAGQLSDVDADDPPDQPVGNVVFSFTTASPSGDSAPAVGATTPVNGATTVAVDSAIVIDFGESVSATASAFVLQCPAGAPQPFAQTGSPANAFTLRLLSICPSARSAQ